MAITTTVTSRPAYGEPGGQFYHPAYDPVNDPLASQVGDSWIRTTYAGCVIATGEINMRDDSDFYAVVWDEENQRVGRVMYASTRFGGGSGCRVDVTPETMRKAQEWGARVGAQRLIDEDKNAATSISKGKTVVVTNSPGRQKLRVGTTGVVLDVEERRSQYGTWSYGHRVMLGIGDPTQTWELTETDSGWELTAPYQRTFPSKARNMGGDWDKERKVWSFPKDVDVDRIKATCNYSFEVRYPQTGWCPMKNVEVVDPDGYRRYGDDFVVDPDVITSLTLRLLTGGAYPVF